MRVGGRGEVSQNQWHCLLLLANTSKNVSTEGRIATTEVGQRARVGNALALLTRPGDQIVLPQYTCSSVPSHDRPLHTTGGGSFEVEGLYCSTGIWNIT